jgi:hypothetical protein
MDLSFDTARVHLDRSTFLRIVGEPGTELTCLQGCLWITRDGSLVDIELPAGHHYVVTDEARVLVCAFEPSLVVVLNPGRSGRQAVTSPPAASAVARVVAAWRRACARPVAVAG